MGEGLSRRGFFRGAAAAGATVATGGADKVVQGAVAAAGGATGIIQNLPLVDRVFSAIKGKFPGHDLYQIWADVFFNHFDEDGDELIDIFRQRIMGDGEWNRHDSTENPSMQEFSNKISICSEVRIFEALQKLPNNIPLLDLLSDEVIQEYNPTDKEDYGEWETETVTLEIAKDLRTLFAPMCDETTTALDLEQKMIGYFERLARHAIQKPSDFVAILRDRGDNRIDISDLLSVLRKGQGDVPEELIQDLEKTRSQVFDTLHEIKQARLDRIQEELDLEAEKINAKQQEKEALDKLSREEPSIREKASVMLQYAQTGEYIVPKRRNDGGRQPKPLRMDWLHFALSINPKVRPKDIEIRADGRMIAIHNSMVLDFVEAQAKEQGGDNFTLELPNRRMGVDLNLAESVSP